MTKRLCKRWLQSRDKNDQVDNEEKRRRVSRATRVSQTRNNRLRERTDVEPTAAAAADATAAADAMDTATVADDRGATADAVVACDQNDHDSGGDQTTLYHYGEW